MAAITKGLKGPSCLDEVARIEALCGAEVSTSDLTEDYYRDATDEAVVYRTEIEEKNS